MGTGWLQNNVPGDEWKALSLSSVSLILCQYSNQAITRLLCHPLLDNLSPHTVGSCYQSDSKNLKIHSALWKLNNCQFQMAAHSLFCIIHLKMNTELTGRIVRIPLHHTKYENCPKLSFKSILNVKLEF